MRFRQGLNANSRSTPSRPGMNGPQAARRVDIVGGGGADEGLGSGPQHGRGGIRHGDDGAGWVKTAIAGSRQQVDGQHQDADLLPASLRTGGSAPSPCARGQRHEQSALLNRLAHGRGNQGARRVDRAMA
jgi:hypothetical protein